jgi:hypothetical protein
MVRGRLEKEYEQMAAIELKQSKEVTFENSDELYS